ncbi:glycosyltransferase [Thiothrix nivea]|nr:glycosyltransferase [Thiothrix nivea]
MSPPTNRRRPDMLFSIIVNTHRRAATLPHTLEALANLRWPHYEIIVVTGPEDDGTSALLQAWQGHIKLAHCPAANLAQSRNIGLQLASGDWIAFTDDDALPEPDWLCRLACHTHDPELGAIGGFVLDHTGRNYQAQYLVSNRFGNTRNQPDWLGAPLNTTRQPEQFLSLMGVNTCFRRQALLDCGGFDEAYAYFLEETDILLRLTERGWKTRVIPDALVHHKFANSHIRHERIVTSLYHIMRSRAYFATRHALPVHGMAALARQLNAWMEEIRQHQHANQRTNTGIAPETLLNEARSGLMDGLKLAQETAAIPPIPATTPESLPFQPTLPAGQRLRLCLVTGGYPPHDTGGVARFMHNLATTLAAMGHEPTVITRTPHQTATIDREQGVWVHRIQPLDAEQRQALPRPSSLPRLPGHVDAFAAAAWQEAYQHHAHRQFHAALGSIWDLDLAWIIAANTLPTWLYLVTTYHQLQAHKPEWHTPDMRHNLLEPMLAAERWVLPNAHLLASTQAIADDTARLTGQTCAADARIIPFGQPDLEQVPDSTSQPDDTFTLLYVGRFEHRKGIDLLLEIAPDLLRRYPQLHIRLVGNDTLAWQGGEPLRQQFERQHPALCADGHLRFLGEISEAALLAEYAGCDCFIAPSRYESFGLMYVEAMRAGKPCIGTDAGGIPEVVQHQCTGLLAAADDAQSLEQAIRFMLDNPDQARQMGMAGRQRFEQRFSNNAFAQAIVQEISPPCSGSGVYSSP